MADFLLKEELFNRKTIGELADIVKQNYKPFEKEKFLKSVFNKEWPGLELKERMRHVTLMLHKAINLNFNDAIGVLNKVSNSCRGFYAIVLSDYVEIYGQDHFDISVQALKRYTECCSSEFAVRPFILKHPKKMMELMYEWSADSNEHVRRLASEGCRPNLPWGMALPIFKKDPAPVITILEKLKNDESEYVRKSVANNLNDISKDNPELVLDIAERWFGEAEHTDKIVKHALRTLLKQGNTRAMKLFGFGGVSDFIVSKIFLSENKIKIGEFVIFEFEIKNVSASEVNCRLEYKVHFVNKKGGTGNKVFQISESIMKPDETRGIRKKHQFIQCSTRTHYPGKHVVEIILNGYTVSQFEIILS